MSIPGKPGQMTGTVRLVGDADGTTETVAGSVRVNMPLVSGKAESLIAQMLGKALRAEHTVGREWLADPD